MTDASVAEAFRRFITSFRLSPIGILIRRSYWRARGRIESRFVDDLRFITRHYERSTGRSLDLGNPQRLTEKLQWLKLFYRDEAMRSCSDKYDVRAYLTQRGYAHFLNDIVGVYDRFEDIDLGLLPERFVLKATHGSGWNLIVQDKGRVNWTIWKRIVRVWMTSELYWFGREWNYANLKPRLLVERYLEDDSGELRDYKVMCLSGVPVWMQIDEHRRKNPKRKFVDRNGEAISMTDQPVGASHSAKSTDVAIEFSDTHREMFEIAADLCAPFPCVRVDFYLHNGRILIGELTFFDGSGFYRLEPDEWDLKFGSMLKLPEPNHNLELLATLKSRTVG